MAQALFLKGNFSELDLRALLAVCRAIEQRKHQPLWYAIMEEAPTYREAANMFGKNEVPFQPVTDAAQPANQLSHLSPSGDKP
jgi:hypothetical protein